MNAALLARRERRNLLSGSTADFGGWVLGAGLTVVGGQLAPDGTNSAYLLNDASDTNAQYILTTLPITLPADFTWWSFIFYFQAASSLHVLASIALSGGTTLFPDVLFTFATESISKEGDTTRARVRKVIDSDGVDRGWRRMHLTVRNNGLATIARPNIYPLNPATEKIGTVKVWHPQFCLGPIVLNPKGVSP